MKYLELAIRTHWAYIIRECNANVLLLQTGPGEVEGFSRERLEKVLEIERELAVAEGVGPEEVLLDVTDRLRRAQDHEAGGLE